MIKRNMNINNDYIIDYSKSITEEYEKWSLYAKEDIDIINDLKMLEQNPSLLQDAFFQDLTFGTGGLRGIIGAGTNRMNLYTVAKATQGLAAYICSGKDKRTAVICYDSRLKSRMFAEITAEVFIANGFHVYLFKEIMPTPCLSYAVRALKCSCGVMITASHNPAQYNGYKVYGADGGQITSGSAEKIQDRIKELDIFNSVKRKDFNIGILNHEIEYIDEKIIDKYIETVKLKSQFQDKNELDFNLKIIYSPLNGTGLKPVMRTLLESGFTNVTIVKEQEKPDGNFPTCPCPNPEIEDAMQLPILYGKRLCAELVIVTDPDCDRVGISVRESKGEYRLLSGNETGILLFDYICKTKVEKGRMPSKPILIKTIVTTDMAERIAKNYGVHTINVLTGFKYIGEQISFLEKQKTEDAFLFAFEESCGYLSGTHVRDKDGVNATLLICEMSAYYKKLGCTLVDILNGLYQKYGYCFNKQHSFKLDGQSGQQKIQKIMSKLRGLKASFGSEKIESYQDYALGINGLPKSNVIKFILGNNCSVIIRPSGTEPKIKFYLSGQAESQEKAFKMETDLWENILLLLGAFEIK